MDDSNPTEEESRGEEITKIITILFYVVMIYLFLEIIGNVIKLLMLLEIIKLH